jgi:hypothetical protein
MIKIWRKMIGELELLGTFSNYPEAQIAMENDDRSLTKTIIEMLTQLEYRGFEAPMLPAPRYFYEVC